MHVVVCLAATAFPAIACSSSDAGAPSSGSGGAPGSGGIFGSGGVAGSGTGGLATGSGGVGLGCNPSCAPPRHCGKSSGACLEDGACAADGDCSEGQKCDAGKCEIGGECGQVAFQMERIAPNIMILLDRSGSMDEDADGDTRWNVAKSAVERVTTEWGDEIRFGLATYSSCLAGGCSAGSIVTPIGPNTAATIRAFLDGTVDQGSSDGRGLTSDGKVKYLCDSDEPETSTGKSLAALVGEPSLLDAGRSNAVILLTDGAETEECVDDCDGPCGAERLLSQSPQVKTYVIGLGVNADDVDAIAESGATGASIPASNLSELSGAFEQIAASVASCDFTLSGAPPNTRELYVFFDDAATPVPSDAANGWSFDTATRRFTLNGTACEQVKTGAVKDIDVVFGCPRPVIE